MPLEAKATKQNAMMIAMLFNKGFQTWHFIGWQNIHQIGWQHIRQPITFMIHTDFWVKQLGSLSSIKH